MIGGSTNAIIQEIDMRARVFLLAVLTLIVAACQQAEPPAPESAPRLAAEPKPEKAPAPLEAPAPAVAPGGP